MAEKPKDFDELLLGSIDQALLSLGKPAMRSIYFHLEEKFEVTRGDIPKDLKRFQTVLERIFGVGARFLEILIMKNLYLKIGRHFVMGENVRLEFIEYVEAAKNSFLSDSCEGAHRRD